MSYHKSWIIMLISCRYHVVLISCWYHVDIMLTSCWYHVNIMLISGWYHVDIRLISGWYHVGIRLISCWYHADIIRNHSSFIIHHSSFIIIIFIFPSFYWLTIHSIPIMIPTLSQHPENISSLSNITLNYPIKYVHTLRISSSFFFKEHTPLRSPIIFPWSSPPRCIAPHSWHVCLWRADRLLPRWVPTPPKCSTAHLRGENHRKINAKWRF